MAKPLISVIIVNWNGKHFLEACLSSMRRQTFRDFELLLVDNGSEDGSAAYVRDNFPEVRLIPLEQNSGFCLANIAGYAQASGELVALLNNDTEAHPRWLEELVKASIEFPAAGSFASKMLYFDERDRIDNCGFGVTTAGFVVERGRSEADGQAWCKPCRVFGACAGAAAYRRSMLEDVGFLDPDFFVYYDDVDLSFRAQLQGFLCMFVPDAIIYHRYRATMRKHTSRTTFLSQRNIEWVYLKCMPLELMITSFPKRLVYELGSTLFFFKERVGTAFLRGKIDAIRQLPAILQKRKLVHSKKCVTNGQLRSVMENDWFSPKWKKLLSAWRRPAIALEAKRP